MIMPLFIHGVYFYRSPLFIDTAADCQCETLAGMAYRRLGYMALWPLKWMGFYRETEHDHIKSIACRTYDKMNMVTGREGEAGNKNNVLHEQVRTDTVCFLNDQAPERISSYNLNKLSVNKNNPIISDKSDDNHIYGDASFNLLDVNKNFECRYLKETEAAYDSGMLSFDSPVDHHFMAATVIRQANKKIKYSTSRLQYLGKKQTKEYTRVGEKIWQVRFGDSRPGFFLMIWRLFFADNSGRKNRIGYYITDAGNCIEFAHLTAMLLRRQGYCKRIDIMGIKGGDHHFIMLDNELIIDSWFGNYFNKAYAWKYLYEYKDNPGEYLMEVFLPFEKIKTIYPVGDDSIYKDNLP